MWRSKDWKNPYFKINPELGLVDSGEGSRQIAFEAGADAMLEALVNWLKERNISKDINDCLIIEGDAFLEFIKEGNDD